MAATARRSVRGSALPFAAALLVIIALSIVFTVGTSDTSGGPSSDERGSVKGALRWPVALEYEYTIVDDEGETTSERHIFYARSWDEWTDITLHDAASFGSVSSGEEAPQTIEDDPDDGGVVIKQYAPDGVETHGVATWADIADHASAQLLDDVDVNSEEELFVDRHGRGSSVAPNYMMNRGQVAFARSSSQIKNASPLPVHQFVQEGVADELGIARESLVGRRYELEDDERAVVFSLGLDVPLWAEVTFAHGGRESMQVVGVPVACESVTCGLTGTD